MARTGRPREFNRDEAVKEQWICSGKKGLKVHHWLNCVQRWGTFLLPVFMLHLVQKSTVPRVSGALHPYLWRDAF